jgi:hypothetical protein
MALTAKVARLDHDQVYFGLDDKAVDELAAGDVVFGDPALADGLPAGAVYVGRDCDLPGGRYKWDGKTFVPLPPTLQKKAESAPDHERAFYELCRCLYNATPAAVPPATIAWCVSYERSFDAVAGLGVDDAQVTGALDFFRNAAKGVQ